MSQNEIGMWHSLGGAPFNVGTCFFGRQKRRATTLKDVSVCKYVSKLSLTWDVRLVGRDVNVIVGGPPLKISNPEESQLLHHLTPSLYISI